MEDLSLFLQNLSSDSTFNATLSDRGGYITFSNSGRRGGVKYFQIGLDSLIQTLKDILAHLDVFGSLTEYVETPWRDKGATFFTDPVANANSTVQTKPLFSTLSKLIIWANQPDLNDLDSDKSICLYREHLETAIKKLEEVADSFKPKKRKTESNLDNQHKCLQSPYRPYITAIKSKPFLLLAGISGTGKSRIVRELARSCWPTDSEEYKMQVPPNFAMTQVKPNWHDSSELIGYVSRISGESKFIVGDFLKFIALAWENWLGDAPARKPYFFCLDEMNLAPVEQYFAEYLSVIESRKLRDGEIKTDPLIKNDVEGFKDLIDKRLAWKSQQAHEQFEREGITLPPNLVVVGTVNMDETTFSFSRKVLDRAMTIEMNEVNLTDGLDSHYDPIGEQSVDAFVGRAVEGVDVYQQYREVCDKCLAYLKEINNHLEGTPFKIAYRTRNEVLLYVVNNLPYNQEASGEPLPQEYVIARALDEITHMKILSRIEGDDTKVSKHFLDVLGGVVKRQLTDISGKAYGANSNTDGVERSIVLAKLEEMSKKLDASGYTSFWS